MAVQAQTPEELRAVRTRRWTWALILYPHTLPLPLISHTVSVDVNHHVEWAGIAQWLERRTRD